MSKLANHDPLVNIYVGDVLDGLRALPAESVQCCVTSPPYFALRDYKMPGQIGLEPTPDAYVARMVEVFREVRRVLRGDGVLLLNLGDSYAATTKGSSGKGDKQRSNAGTLLADRRWRVPDGLKPKDLIGIPWLLAFALRADGWYLRQDIIWHKPAPMPESVTDRCTKAHEYLFLLAKSERYYWDAEAIKEASKYPDDNRKARQRPDDYLMQMGDSGRIRAVINPSGDRTYPTRNRRSVWTITTRAFRGAHFATFPPDLVHPCIAAGSKPGDTVLDPFSGSGTTGAVARVMGRAYAGTELNPDYAAMWDARLADVRKWWDKRQGAKPKRASVKSMGESLLFNVA